MKKKQLYFLQKLFPKKVINESPDINLANEQIYSNHLILKRLMIVSVIFLFMATPVFAQETDYYPGNQSSITIKATQAPPPLPDYVQPVCPGDGYIWIPGYWSWASNNYYWVPGVWVMPPAINLLWTPGYWGFFDSFYGWNPGYWGAQVGYYGGINYGFGYFGTGFYGGRWERGHFMYNTSVWHVGKNIHNTYINKITINNNNRASFNGVGGVKYHPGKNEPRVVQNHMPASKEQMGHERNMGNEKGQFNNMNNKPAVHSMSKPGGQRFDQGGHEMRMAGNQGRGGGRKGRG